jgi:hypothetical protein
MALPPTDMQCQVMQPKRTRIQLFATLWVGGGGAFQPTVCKRPIQGEARDGMTALSLPRGILSAYNNTESRLALRSLTAQTHILASFQ